MARIPEETENLLTYLRRELPARWLLHLPRSDLHGATVCAQQYDGKFFITRGYLLVRGEYCCDTCTTHYRFLAVTQVVGLHVPPCNAPSWFETPKEAIAYWELTK